MESSFGSGGPSGVAGFERVLRKISEITERFQLAQENIPESKKSDAADRPAEESFRSALNRAQERQSMDGKSEEKAAPVAKARPATGEPTTAMEKRLMDTLRKELPNHNVPADLALAVMQAESKFNPGAVSPKGAIGVMQIMPATAAELGIENSKDLFEPEVNIPTGLKYLSNLLSRYQGDEQKALAAYNAGPGAVAKHGGVPPYTETKDYIKKVMEIRQKLNAGTFGEGPES